MSSGASGELPAGGANWAGRCYHPRSAWRRVVTSSAAFRAPISSFGDGAPKCFRECQFTAAGAVKRTVPLIQRDSSSLPAVRIGLAVPATILSESNNPALAILFVSSRALAAKPTSHLPFQLRAVQRS
jgi:hypothetical protein